MEDAAAAAAAGGPQKTVVLDVVALSRNLISAEYTPFLHGYLSRSDVLDRDVEPAFPALTCPAQSTYLSGTGPVTHGITANGFYDRSYCEVKNWHQSSKLVRAPRIWDALKARHPEATVFVNGLWHGMHDHEIDYFINVRPQYLQNGGKVADIYTHPAGLREELQGSLGTFPLHRFWGPGTSIESSKWTAAAALQVDKEHDPTLALIYLPHLDYSLQKYGPPPSSEQGTATTNPDDPDSKVLKDLKEIDEVVEGLVRYYESEAVGARVVILSEYAIERVDRPVYLNRVLREEGLVQVRKENGGETLDCGECRAFALCDHQVAHVHVRHAADIPLVRRVLSSTPGVEMVMDASELDAYYRDRGKSGEGGSGSEGGGGAAVAAMAGEGGRRASGGRGAHHPERSGELVAVSDSRSWFAYYYWKDDSQAPDFARCVAIHRKPGYDPAEMFYRFPGFAGFAWLILKLLLSYGLKLRTNVDATPLRCDKIRGSHGRLPGGAEDRDDEPRPIIMFKTNGAGVGRAGAVGVDPLAIDDGQVLELGREACLEKGRVVVAEDVYEVLWRILNRDI
ncbi:unnamed protein product [Ectocarpus sp. CCAP 1310/34]|nr:unnamed protein product [Ectocarpus sp. CCAP 1310/34]